MRITQGFETEAIGSHCFSVRFSPDATWLAASGAQGRVSIFNVSTRQEAYRLNIMEHEQHPVKQVCWRPERSDASTRTRGVLVGASTDGKVRQWHVTSKRLLQTWGDPQVTGQLYCVDYASDGSKAAAAGQHPTIFVCDEETKAVTEMTGGDSLTTPGHASRIFAIRFPPAGALSNHGSNIILSGGWDNSVQVWDLRIGHAVRAIFGPGISGDGLDVDAAGKSVLTASWREEDPLERWDLGSGQKIESIPWRASDTKFRPPCSLYCARFSKDAGSKFIAAGGSMSNEGLGEAKIFDREAARRDPKTPMCIGTVPKMSVLSMDFSADGAQLAVGGSGGRVRVSTMNNSLSLKEEDLLPLDYLDESWAQLGNRSNANSKDVVTAADFPNKEDLEYHLDPDDMESEGGDSEDYENNDKLWSTEEHRQEPTTSGRARVPAPIPPNQGYPAA
mmetsp:Transcript_20986/g.45383  ORF Transcript_20986/g.45383 Transcript_20986/m.45383 type:complete len:447 (+) Transcript_20986:146-1486(+)